MEKIPVTVEICGVQRSGEEETVTQSRSDGCLSAQRDKIYISYQETIEGAGLVPSLLTIMQDTIRLTRRGSLSAQMEFACGKRTAARYDTGAGQIPLTISTQDVKISRVDAGTMRQPLTAEVAYELYAGRTLLSCNQLTIRIERKL